MRTISIGKPHNFKKKNLVTQSSRKGTYDIYECENCGIVGKAFQLGTIQIKDSYSDEKAEYCLNKKSVITNVKVTGDYVCNNFGLEKNKEYQICECPEEYKDRFSLDVWVFSEKRGEAVRLLPEEFEVIKNL